MSLSWGGVSSLPGKFKSLLYATRYSPVLQSAKSPVSLGVEDQLKKNATNCITRLTSEHAREDMGGSNKEMPRLRS